MFAQVITASVTDRDAVERQALKWRDELRPGAIGYLGGTGGVADDGTLVLVARFESAEAAQANSDRPEQGAWWAETEPHLTDVRFAESTDVTLQFGGGSDAAGFVQVMRGHIVDAAAYDTMMGKMADVEATMKELRPDVLGGVTVRFTDDRYVDVIYFESEALAREGEARDMPAELQQDFEGMMSAAEVDQFVDLRQPWIW